MQSSKLVLLRRDFLIPWILATRPKTLLAIICPILLGLSAVLVEIQEQKLMLDHIQWSVLPLILICGILIQIICNFANDLYDHIKGADTKDRIGPERMVQTGLISPRSMRYALFILVLITVVIGSILVYIGGWNILLIGLASIFLAFAYTSGPFPLSYLGLGEPFVLIFFGPVPVYGTIHLLAGEIGIVNYRLVLYLILSLGISSISTALMVVNNIRDREQDIKVNKRTVSVRLGDKLCRYEYFFWLCISAITPLITFFLGMTSTVLIIYLVVPYMLNLLFLSWRANSNQQFADLLSKTAQLLPIYSVLLILALMLS